MPIRIASSSESCFTSGVAPTACTLPAYGLTAEFVGLLCARAAPQAIAAAKPTIAFFIVRKVIRILLLDQNTCCGLPKIKQASFPLSRHLSTDKSVAQTLISP